MSIHVVAHFKAQAGKSEELKKVLVGLVAPTRHEAGCINYRLMQNADDADAFTFVEEWESREHLNVHLGAPHFVAAQKEFALLVTGEVVVGVHTIVA